MFRPTEFRAAEHLTHAVQAIVLTSVVEHHTGVDQPDFDRRLEAFEQEVILHATREEGDEFLRLRGTVDADTLRRMAGQR